MATYTVNVFGDLDSSNGYATIAGTKTTTGGTNTYTSKPTIAVYVSSSRFDVRSKCEVTLNGTTVKSGYGSYTADIGDADTVNIRFAAVPSGSYTYYTCDIFTKKSSSGGSSGSGGGHYANIGSAAREIEVGTVRLNGVAREIESGMTLVGGVAREIAFSSAPAFADVTWEQVIIACQNNEVPDTWAVGDSKPMTINGTSYQIDIIGKNHDDYADGTGKAPLTFQMHDCYGTLYSINGTSVTKVAWGSSRMKKTELPGILKTMPSEVQSGIREVSKTARKTTNAETLFLLSEYEIFGRKTYAYTEEGSQYAYYADGNSTIKNFNGSARLWLTRSERNITEGSYGCVSINGGASSTNTDNKSGVAFGFCF